MKPTTTTRSMFVSVSIAALVLMAAGSVHALPTQVVHVNTPDCDPLFIPTDVEEIGDFTVFPADESLDAQDLGQSPIIPCPANNDTLIPDVVVDMRNLTGRKWSEVWYVANPDTSISNFDGIANDAAFPLGHFAFRIDRFASDPLGGHHPLIAESGTPDGIWEIGESWTFVLQDYGNALGLGPDKIDSLGIGDASPLVGIIPSTLSPLDKQ